MPRASCLDVRICGDVDYALNTLTGVHLFRHAAYRSGVETSETHFKEPEAPCAALCKLSREIGLFTLTAASG